MKGMFRGFLLVLAFTLFPVSSWAISLVHQDTTHAYCDGPASSRIRYAIIDHNTSGDNTVIAAVAGKSLKVLSYSMTATGSVTARWESGAGGTALSGQMTMATGVPIVCNGAPYGCFQTGVGALLNLELSGAVSVDGHITYVECG